MWDKKLNLLFSGQKYIRKLWRFLWATFQVVNNEDWNYPSKTSLLINCKQYSFVEVERTCSCFFRMSGHLTDLLPIGFPIVKRSIHIIAWKLDSIMCSWMRRARLWCVSMGLDLTWKLIKNANRRDISKYIINKKNSYIM